MFSLEIDFSRKFLRHGAGAMRHATAAREFDNLRRAADNLTRAAEQVDARRPQADACRIARAARACQLPKLRPTSSDFDSGVESRITGTIRVPTWYPIYNKIPWRVTHFENSRKMLRNLRNDRKNAPTLYSNFVPRARNSLLSSNM